MREIGTVTKRVLVAGIMALAMAVGLASAGAGAAVAASGDGVLVGKSAAGKITSKVVGSTSAGDRVRGSFTPIRTVQRNGTLYVKGFLRGVIADAGPDTRFSGVKTIPVKKINGSSLTNARSAAAAQCEILNLVLGPLDLDLLGLKIHLDRVVLNITAESGPGNLLGNLLCDVAGLLDGGLSGLLGQLRTLLNRVLGLLNLGL